MAQPQNITPEQATAYTKGWTSTAKTFDAALDSAKWMDKLPTAEERVDLYSYFEAGFQDRQDGSAKWDRLSAPKHEAEEGTTNVETDGVVVAVTRHLELVPDETPTLEEVQEEAPEEFEIVRHEDHAGLAAVLRVPAHEVIDGAEVEAGTPEDEVADALAEIQDTPEQIVNHERVVEATRGWKLNGFGETIKRISEENAAAAEEAHEEATSDEWVSIASLRRLAAETPRGAARQAVRALVVTKKGAYRRGFTAATEGKILSEAKETYLAKRDPKFLQDFVQGYEDAANKRGMGASWE